MSTTIFPFNPSSYRKYPGYCRDPQGWRTFAVEAEQIDSALKDLRLEDAKDLICNKYGNKSLKTVQELARVVDAIVTLNKQPLSKEHQKLNYSLDAAHGLACHMYTIAHNATPSGSFLPNLHMPVAAGAIMQVARAYKDKGESQNAIRSIRRLETTYGELHTQRLIEVVIG